MSTASEGWYPTDVTIVRQSYGQNGLELCYNCPECGKDNLWWNVSIQKGQCFTCQEGLGVEGMKRLFGEQQTFIDIWNELQAARPPRKVRELKEAAWQDSPLAKLFLLKNRRCRPKDLDRSGVIYDEETDRVLFPLQRCRPGGLSQSIYMSRSTNPTTKGWLFRSEEDAHKDRYWYNPLGLRPESQTIILVEGVFDVLSPQLLGAAIAICGTNLTEYHEDALKNAKRVIVWLDADQAGRKAARFRVSRQVPNSSFISYNKEPGDCTPVEARQVVMQHLKEEKEKKQHGRDIRKQR